MSQQSSSSGLPFKSTKQLIKALDSLTDLLTDMYSNAEEILELLDDFAEISVNVNKKPFKALVSHDKILCYLTKIISHEIDMRGK